MNTLLAKNVFLAGLLFLASLTTGCDSNDAGNDPPVAGEFVGRATGVEDLVSVVADQPGANGLRRVRIYLCDGTSRGEWFTGTFDGNTIELTSVTGNAIVRATLASDHASGTITLLDGTRIAFDVPPARDGAGLYDPVVLDASGRFSSTSISGATLEGQIGADGVRSGTIVLPDGRRFDFEHQSDVAQPTGEYTLLALPAGQEFRGFDKGIKTKNGFTWHWPDV